MMTFLKKKKEMSEMTRAKSGKNAKVAVQQYTKTAAHLDQLGEQARKLRQEIADATDAVADTREELKGYNE
jgi:septal ring factor EnvC (AmiA/AmiB activator)